MLTGKSRTSVWRHANLERYRKQSRKYIKKNRKRINEYYKAYPNKCLNSWIGVIPKETVCLMCGKKIYFDPDDNLDAIHFDHRHGGKEVIKQNPSQWLRQHKHSLKNEAIWKSCDFGSLCVRCNSSLPTINRRKYLENLTRYVNESEGEIFST